MKFIQKLLTSLRIVLNIIVKAIQFVFTIISRFYISDKLVFIAAVLGFLGTFIIIMDNFGFIHERIDKLEINQNISAAIINLDTFDTNSSNGLKIGRLDIGEQGFNELLTIVQENRPDLKNKSIVAIAKNQPMELGGVPFKIVHVVYANNNSAESLTTEYLFYEWVSNYREKVFLKYGLFVIAIGFFVGICGNIKRKSQMST